MGGPLSKAFLPSPGCLFSEARDSSLPSSHMLLQRQYWSWTQWQGSRSRCGVRPPADSLRLVNGGL